MTSSTAHVCPKSSRRVRLASVLPSTVSLPCTLSSTKAFPFPEVSTSRFCSNFSAQPACSGVALPSGLILASDLTRDQFVLSIHLWLHDPLSRASLYSNGCYAILNIGSAYHPSCFYVPAVTFYISAFSLAFVHGPTFTRLLIASLRHSAFSSVHRSSSLREGKKHHTIHCRHTFHLD